MTVQTSVQVIGVKNALKEINKINPALRRDITRRYKQIVKPAIDEISRSVPSDAPLRGMEQPWTPRRASGRSQVTIQGWNKGEFGKSIVAKINTRRAMPRFMGNEVSAAFRIIVRYGWALAADMGGRRSSGNTPQGRAMITALRQKYGDASRFIWPSWFQAFPQVENEMRRLVEDIMRQVRQRVQWVK